MIRVAAGTGYVCVATGEEEIRRRMIESRILPTSLVVTVIAGGAHLQKMNIILRMAADAGIRSLTTRSSKRVAIGAEQHDVCASQHHVRPAVIESFIVRVDNVGLAAFVVGVA